MGADEIVKGIAGIKASLASRSHEKQASVGSNGCGNQPGPDGGVGGLLFSPLRWRRLHGIHYPGHDHIPLQYNFTINGFDTEGKKTSIQIEFKNDKPAKQLIGELTAFTGLAMGQTRSAEEILTAERDGETTLQSLAKAKEPTTIGPQSQPRVAMAEQKCWSSYLERNPAMAKWADANPAQADQNKKRFDDC